MANVPITIIAGTLPAGAVYNAQTYFNAMVARMSATVSDGNIIWGQLGGAEPTGALPGTAGQAGLWYGGGYWHDWDSSVNRYTPIKLVCGQYYSGAVRITLITSTATANRTIATPDKNGTFALLSDLPRTQGTTVNTPAGPVDTISLDWSDLSPRYILLSGDLTINHVNDVDGAIMDIWLQNASHSPTTNYNLTMPGVVWGVPPGTPPTLSNGAVGKLVVDHIRVSRIHGTLFGEVPEQNFQI